MSIKESSLKDIALWGLVGVSSVTGVGNTVYEAQFEDHDPNSAEILAVEAEIEELEDKLVSLQIQLCLAVNQINRNAGQRNLAECGI